MDDLAERWNFLPRFSKLFAEPILCVFIGLVLVAMFTFVGAWFIISGILLFFYEFMVWQNIQHRYLDRIDGRLEAEYEAELRNPEVSMEKLKQTQEERKLPVHMPIASVRARILEAREMEKRSRDNLVSQEAIVV